MKHLSIAAFAPLLVLAALSGVGTAQDLGLDGDDVNWASPGDPSPEFLFRIYNDTGTSDQLSGWQLSIEVIPSPTATGTVQINSVTAPDDYILTGSLGILVPPVLPATRVVGIHDLSFAGADVPPPPGGELLELGFLASPDAAGRFDVAAIPGEFSTNWLFIDFQPPPLPPDPDFYTREFVNVPFNSPDAVTIGSVTIGATSVVPEPSSLALMVGLFGMGLGLRRPARRRNCRWRA